MTMLLSAAQVVTPARILAPGWLHVVGDRVAGLGEGAPPVPPDLDLGDEVWISPRRGAQAVPVLPPAGGLVGATS